MKKTVAFIIKGGIGVGFKLEGCVWLVELCETIAKEYDLTVFSFVKADEGYQPKGYTLISSPFGNSGHMMAQLSFLLPRFIQLNGQKKFDIVHGFWAYPSGVMTVLVSKMWGIKSVLTFIGGEAANIPSIRYGLYQNTLKKRLIQYIARQVDCVVAQTRFQARLLDEETPYKRLELISFGIDTSKFSVTAKSLGAPFRFLYVGNINRVKDLPTLLKTFQLIGSRAEATLDIVGLDTLNGEMQALASKLGVADKVTFHGPRLNNELKPFFENAHVLLLTSLSEMHGLVANEAMASGVVVCGTRVGILDDLADDITTVVAIGDAEALAEKVVYLLENPQQYEELRQKGIRWSNEHNLDVQSGRYSLLYRELLS